MDITSFHDFDAFADSVRDIDCVMMLQNPNRRTWTISHADVAGIHVQLGKLGSGNIVDGQSFSAGYVLYLPLTDACEYSANGTVLNRGSFMICEPQCEFCISTKFEHDWCSIFVPSNKFLSGHDISRESSGSEKTRCRVSRPNRQIAAQFKALVHQVMTAASCCPQFESSPAAPGAAAELLKIASAVIENRNPGEGKPIGRPKVSRTQIIRRCRGLLEERRDERIDMQELAAAAQVSDRTLRAAFQEYFGVGPAGYLQLRRLHQVNRDLKSADSETAHVGNVLVQYGISDFGRFAARYHQLFGERPSETLRMKSRQTLLGRMTDSRI